MGTLEIKNLKLTLGKKQILKGIDIDFWPGYIHAIVGPNGAGKSTLASTIMGREGYTHYEGEIFLNGKSIDNLSIDERAREGITLAWQEPARFEGLTIRDFIKASAKNKTEQTIIEALNIVGLNPDSYIDRAVDKTLSGGERKKIELASIFVMKPKVVLLDEPDSGIDVASLEKIFDVMKILKDEGSTIILITHSETVLKQAEHAFLMCNGRLLKKGITDSIYEYFDDQCMLCDHKNAPTEMEGEL